MGYGFFGRPGKLALEGSSPKGRDSLQNDRSAARKGKCDRFFRGDITDAVKTLVREAFKVGGEKVKK